MKYRKFLLILFFLLFSLSCVFADAAKTGVSAKSKAPAAKSTKQEKPLFEKVGKPSMFSEFSIVALPYSLSHIKSYDPVSGRLSRAVSIYGAGLNLIYDYTLSHVRLGVSAGCTADFEFMALKDSELNPDCLLPYFMLDFLARVGFPINVNSKASIIPTIKGGLAVTLVNRDNNTCPAVGLELMSRIDLKERFSIIAGFDGLYLFEKADFEKTGARTISVSFNMGVLWRFGERW